MKAIQRIVLLLLCTVLVCSFAACAGETEENEKMSNFAVIYNGTEIELGKPADSVLKALGEPIYRSEIGDCGGLGAQVRYEYSSLVLYVLESEDDGNVIDQVTLTDDLIATAKGITIGSSEEELRELYGEPSKTEGDVLSYISGNKYLIFKISNGTVSAIDLLRVTA